MFSILLANNYNNILKNDAANYIAVDRKQYSPMIDTILKIANKEKLLISNIDLLIHNNDQKFDKYLDFVQIYCNNAEEIAKKISQELCEQFGEKLLMRSTEWEKSYNIEYNLRKICNIKTLIINEKYSITDFINPIEKKYHNITILLSPPLLEVIDLYRILYNPTMAESWEDTFILIKKLEEGMKSTIIFGGENNEKSVGVSRDTPKKSKKIDIIKYLLEFASSSEYVLIGDIAHKFSEADVEISELIESIKSEPIKPEYDLSIKYIAVISKNDIEIDYKMLITFLSKFTDNKIVYKQQKIHIDDIMIKKYVFYLADDKNRQILTIYNNMNYEMINYIPVKNKYGNFKIADPITQIRFIYIEIWELIISGKILNEVEKSDKLIQEKYKQLEFYKDKINIYEEKRNYIGHYIDPNIQRKNLNILNPNINKSAYYCFDLKQ